MQPLFGKKQFIALLISYLYLGIYCTAQSKWEYIAPPEAYRPLYKIVRHEDGSLYALSDYGLLKGDSLGEKWEYVKYNLSPRTQNMIIRGDHLFFLAVNGVEVRMTNLKSLDRPDTLIYQNIPYCLDIARKDDTLLFVTTAGIARSTDFGTTLTMSLDEDTYQTTLFKNELEYLLEVDSKLFYRSKTGIYSSQDFGKTWIRKTQGLTTALFAMKNYLYYTESTWGKLFRASPDFSTVDTIDFDYGNTPPPFYTYPPFLFSHGDTLFFARNNYGKNDLLYSLDGGFSFAPSLYTPPIPYDSMACLEPFNGKIYTGKNGLFEFNSPDIDKRYLSSIPLTSKIHHIGSANGVLWANINDKVYFRKNNGEWEVAPIDYSPDPVSNRPNNTLHIINDVVYIINRFGIYINQNNDVDFGHIGWPLGTGYTNENDFLVNEKNVYFLKYPYIYQVDLVNFGLFRYHVGDLLPLTNPVLVGRGIGEELYIAALGDWYRSEGTDGSWLKIPIDCPGSFEILEGVVDDALIYSCLSTTNQYIFNNDTSRQYFPQDWTTGRPFFGVFESERTFYEKNRAWKFILPNRPDNDAPKHIEAFFSQNPYGHYYPLKNNILPISTPVSAFSKVGNTIWIGTESEGIWTMELSNELIFEYGNPKFKLFPNPFSSRFTLQSEDFLLDTKATYLIFDSVGKLVKTGELFSGHTWEINLDGCQRGVYFVKIETAHSTSTLRAIKK